MPRPKPQTREERLEKKRLCEKRRKERIKSNDVSREESIRKDKERYARRKAAGVIVPRHQMSPIELKILRRKNKISANAYYYRKKNRAVAAPLETRGELDGPVGDVVEDEPDPLLTNKNEEDNKSSGLSTSHHNTPSTTRVSRYITKPTQSVLDSDHGLHHDLPDDDADSNGYELELKQEGVDFENSGEESETQFIFISSKSNNNSIVDKPENVNDGIQHKNPISQLEDNIGELTKPVPKQTDEFQMFANHVAEQLRILPLDKALGLQVEIQKMIAKQRISIYKAANGEN